MPVILRVQTRGRDFLERDEPQVDGKPRGGGDATAGEKRREDAPHSKAFGETFRAAALWTAARPRAAFATLRRPMKLLQTRSRGGSVPPCAVPGAPAPHARRQEPPEDQARRHRAVAPARVKMVHPAPIITRACLVPQENKIFFDAALRASGLPGHPLRAGRCGCSDTRTSSPRRGGFAGRGERRRRISRPCIPRPSCR